MNQLMQTLLNLSLTFLGAAIVYQLIRWLSL